MPYVSEPPVVVSAVKTLTASQIAALGSTPVEIVPAITGRKILPLGGVFEYVAGTTGFASNAVIDLNQTNSIMETISSVPLSGTTSKTYAFQPTTTGEVHAAAALTVACGDTIGAVGPILTSSLASGGLLWVPGDTATVQDGTGGLITVSTVTNSFLINQVNQGAKTFRLTGDATAFTAGPSLTVYRSTGNDGNYTIDTVGAFSGGNTIITVLEAIPDGTANGRAGDTHLGDVGGIATYALTTAGTGYTVLSHNLTAVAPSAGTDASINVLTITSQSDGTARVTVFYSVV